MPAFVMILILLFIADTAWCWGVDTRHYRHSAHEYWWPNQ
jgi:hypothetical protein